MRAQLLVQALLAGAVLVVAAAPPADAQGGLGKGRNRQREQAAPKESAGSEEPAPGEYPLEGPKALEVINRGEGPQALAYYERTAEQSEQQGDQLRAARAWHVAGVVALRLGRYQKAIQSSNRSIDLFKGINELTQEGVGRWASAYAQLGAAYRAVSDLAQAQRAFEEGLALATTRMSGRREGQVEGFLLNGLASVAYAQRDYQTALARNTQAAQFFEGAQVRLGPKVSEQRRTNLRRWTAMSFLGIGRAQLALGHPDEADAAFDRGLKYARLSGHRAVEAEILGGQGSLALSRKDWSKAAGIYQQAIALATQTKRTSTLAHLHQGLAARSRGSAAPTRRSPRRGRPCATWRRMGNRQPPARRPRRSTATTRPSSTASGRRTANRLRSWRWSR